MLAGISVTAKPCGAPGFSRIGRCSTNWWAGIVQDDTAFSNQLANRGGFSNGTSAVGTSPSFGSFLHFTPQTMMPPSEFPKPEIAFARFFRSSSASFALAGCVPTCLKSSQSDSDWKSCISWSIVTVPPSMMRSNRSRARDILRMVSSYPPSGSRAMKWFRVATLMSAVAEHVRRALPRKSKNRAEDREDQRGAMPHPETSKPAALGQVIRNGCYSEVGFDNKPNTKSDPDNGLRRAL